jgi:hypothetical protein
MRLPWCADAPAGAAARDAAGQAVARGGGVAHILHPHLQVQLLLPAVAGCLLADRGQCWSADIDMADILDASRCSQNGDKLGIYNHMSGSGHAAKQRWTLGVVANSQS